MPTVGGSSAVTQVPGYAPGGAAGQYLNKTDTPDYVSGWTGVTIGGERPYQSGQWYDTAYMWTTANNGLAALGSYCYYAPVYFGRPLTIVKLGITISAATVGTVMNLGINTSLPAGKPGTVVAAVTSTVTAVNQAVIVSLPTPVTMPAGWSYFSCASNGNTYTVNGDTPDKYPSPIAPNWDNLATAAQNQNMYYTGLCYINAVTTNTNSPAVTTAVPVQYSIIPSFHFQVA